MMISWKIIILCGLLLLTLAGLWLIISGSRGKNRRVLWAEFRVHLGTALLISAITITLIDLHLQSEFERSVAQIPAGVLQLRLRNDPGLEVAVNQQIIENQIRYSNVVTTAILEAKPNADFPYADYNWKTEYDVRVVGDAPVDWVFHPLVTSDLEKDPEAKIESLPSLTEEGNETNLIKPEEFHAKTGYKEEHGRAEFQKKLTLKPHVRYHVAIRYFIHDRLLLGSVEHKSRRIVSKIRYDISADPSLFDVEIIESFPPGRTIQLSPNEKRRGSVPFRSHDILETLLPFQGYKVQWKFKGAIRNPGSPVKPTQ